MPPLRPLAVAALLLLAVALAACSPTRLGRAAADRRFAAAGLEPVEIPLPGGGRLAARAGGSGPPLVLLMGFGAEAPIQWQQQVRPFAARHRLFVPDLLWFGGSVGAPGAIRVEDQVAAVRAGMDALGIGRADVVGISFGGIVAWGLAGAHPERVRRLVIVSSPGPAFTPEDHAAALARIGVPSLHELLLPAAPSGVQTTLGIVVPGLPALPARALADLHAGFFSPPHRAEQSAMLDDLLRRMDAPDPSLPRPQAPTLLVWGDEDPLFPPGIAERLAALLPGGAETVVLPGAAHGPPASNPRGFNRAVLDFLAAPAE
jgi:pimeloyl-ACP methyl ester carboxylesterase